MLEVKNLKAGYGRTEIVKGVSFTVNDGEILTFIGQNGSGKSTLLKTISGHLDPHGGEMLIDGVPLSSVSRNEHAKLVSAMLTDRPKTDMMTCREVVESGRYPYTGTFGILSEDDKRSVSEAMDLTDTSSLARRSFSAISDGQKQRVMLARAVCREPRVMLFDEPTSFLDIHYKLTFLEMIDRLRREKKLSVVMSLHETDLAARISDSVLMLKNGECGGIGKPEELLDRETLIKYFDVSRELYDKYHG